MTNHVDADVAMENAAHEAVIRQAYRDSVGVWTWSVGMTDATGHRVGRYIGNPQSMEHCLAVYVWALENYADHVREVFKDNPLTKAQFAAALSFTWNLGGGALRRAAWVGHFKAGRMAEAERAFKTWRKAGGKVSKGLVARRASEADLLFRGKWSNTGSMTEYTRLTAGSTPVWSSAKQVNVERELQAAFGAAPPAIDHAPQPDKEPDAPTLSPTQHPSRHHRPPVPAPDSQDGHWLKLLAGLLAAAVAGAIAWINFGG